MTTKAGRRRVALAPEQEALLEKANDEYREFRRIESEAKEIAQGIVDRMIAEGRQKAAKAISEAHDSGIATYRISKRIMNTGDLRLAKRLIEEGQTNE